jgi:hypothetical protein
VTAGLSVQETRPGGLESFDNPWIGLGLFAAYTFAALLLAAWSLRSRDT